MKFYFEEDLTTKTMKPPPEADWNEYMSHQKSALLNECQNVLIELLNTGSTNTSLLALRQTFLESRKFFRKVFEADDGGLSDFLYGIEGAEELGLVKQRSREKEMLKHAFKLMIEQLIPQIKSDPQLSDKADEFGKLLDDLRDMMDIET